MRPTAVRHSGLGADIRPPVLLKSSAKESRRRRNPIPRTRASPDNSSAVAFKKSAAAGKGEGVAAAKLRRATSGSGT
jgi:hypothetical protein